MLYDNEVVNLFGKFMIKELNANKAKGDWREWDWKVQWAGEVLYHIVKLMKALANNDKYLIQEYCADIANLVMFVAFCSGAIDGKE